MNEYSKDLCHWALGKEAKNHKYVAREPGKKQGQYIYFYDISKWKNWKNGVKKAADAVTKSFDSGKATFDRIVKSKAKGLAYEAASSQVTANKRNTDSPVKALLDRIKNVAVSAIKKVATSKIGKAVINFINKIAGKKVIDIANPDDKQTMTNENSQKKYVAKVKINGKYRYFYDMDQYYEWYRRQKYQKDEPDFMKDIPEIEPDDDGNMPSIAEDSSAINHGYFTEPGASVNCWHCTTAYDLRKRGYDVSAKPVKSEFDEGDIGVFYDVDAEMEAWHTEKTSNKKEIEAQKEINRYLINDGINEAGDEMRNNTVQKLLDKNKIVASRVLSDNKNATVSVIPAKAIAKYVDRHPSESISETVNNQDKYSSAMRESVEDSIKRYPKGSWGRVCVDWAGGGAHAFVWEKDTNGKVTFFDPQLNITVDIKEYCKDTSKGSAINIIRTDDLQIKQSVLDYVTPHTIDNEYAFDEIVPKRKE